LQRRSIPDRIVLALVRFWTVLAHGSVWRHSLRGGVWPDPVTPSSDVDKFMWRKLFDHNPFFAITCDKIAAKRYALSRCPEIKTAEVLWSGYDAREIPESVLSGDVVVKASAGCGRNFMIRNGEFDRAALRLSTSKWMRRRYGVGKGEWAYQAANQCLFVERMLLEKGLPVRSEYKFHVADGRLTYVFARQLTEAGGEETSYLDAGGKVIAGRTERDATQPAFAAPTMFDKMKRMAETLAASCDYMRVDLYEIEGEIFFSELTCYPLSGRGGSNAYLRALRNSAWDIRKSWFLTSPQPGWRRRYAEALRRWLDVNAQVDRL
jgi:TupA-like ATPgrasp